MVDTGPRREAIENTGAVLMGRNAYAMAQDPDFYAEGYEFQVPIFVLTHSVPDRRPKENERLKLTFVTSGLDSAVAQAGQAAGKKDTTVVGGASAVQ